MGRAEIMFREAFARLKKNQPERMPKGTPVTQNNVAKESGVDPSALRSSRYPELCAEIKKWAQEHPAKGTESVRQVTIAKRAATRQLRDRIRDVEAQRDHAASRLVAAEAEVVRLAQRVASLEAILADNKKVTVLPKRKET
jgi:BMFP domain-containing protein YqiC